MNAAMAVSGNVGGSVTRQLLMASWHSHRLYHGGGENRSELVSKVVVPMDWSSSCIMKGMGWGGWGTCWYLLCLYWFGWDVGQFGGER